MTDTNLPSTTARLMATGSSLRHAAYELPNPRVLRHLAPRSQHPETSGYVGDARRVGPTQVFGTEGVVGGPAACSERAS
jgi:hypothetical protein